MSGGGRRKATGNELRLKRAQTMSGIGDKTKQTQRWEGRLVGWVAPTALHGPQCGTAVLQNELRVAAAHAGTHAKARHRSV